jgi:hypothetical protein
MKIKDILIQIFLILWQLPQCLVGLVMLPFLGKLRLIRHEKYCWIFEGEKMSGGISLGCFIFLSPYSAQNEATIRHELGHVVQSHMLSWLYLILGLCSLLNAIFNFTDCYYDYWCESWANKLGGVEKIDKGYGCSIKIKEDN